MENITLESYMSFCDNMMIAEEGLFKKKENVFLDSFFNLESVPEESLNSAKEVISKITSDWKSYEDKITSAINEWTNSNYKSMKFKLLQPQKAGIQVKVADKNDQFKIELDSGVATLPYKKGDILITFKVINKSMKLCANLAFVNSTLMTPINVFEVN